MRLSRDKGMLRQGKRKKNVAKMWYTADLFAIVTAYSQVF